MERIDVLPELKQIAGAILFAAKQPVTATRIREVLAQVAEEQGGPYRDFASLKDADVEAAIRQIGEDLEKARLGIVLGDLAHGFRFENDVACGVWVRRFLEKGKPSRLSRPALETLAIIAYRQPCTRAEIEAVRGVAVDTILRNLMELQLVRITGRSELPGRPMMYGTTQTFLEYFGIKNLNDLPGITELRRPEDGRPEADEQVFEEPAADSAPAEVPEDNSRAKEDDHES
ncbi:MAG TPA: SMC-Scp complex subunit ScpB [Kiritimatiellia bacterium]|nr:SMC-Scp complex subunit ScpB [Kiritimatiellia bacterium]HNS80248.1 SMC-Scp complex subunit ScpB [Kiritimatiellia bacterium]